MLRLWVLNACEKVNGRVARVVAGRRGLKSDRKRTAVVVVLGSPVGWINGLPVVKHT